jgi:hypothetical protein
LGELGRQTEHVLEEGLNGRGRRVDWGGRCGRRWRRDGETRSWNGRERRRRRRRSSARRSGSYCGLDKGRKRRKWRRGRKGGRGSSNKASVGSRLGSLGQLTHGQNLVQRQVVVVMRKEGGGWRHGRRRRRRTGGRRDAGHAFDVECRGSRGEGGRWERLARARSAGRRPPCRARACVQACVV